MGIAKYDKFERYVYNAFLCDFDKFLLALIFFDKKFHFCCFFVTIPGEISTKISFSA